MQELIVNRSNISETRLVNSEQPSLNEGEALLRVERFALTANNITYGVAGDMIGYWNFFPATEGWGKIPVWGIAQVVDANGTELNDGERYYGYFPMSETLVVTPKKAGPRGFTDGAAHRQDLPVVYNQYALMTAENGFEPAHDNHKMVYAPLFTTSFVLEDFFADSDDFGAQQIIIGSASSKTAIGLAFQLQQSGRVKTVGLTSPGNLEFVKSLGLYDKVVGYSDVSDLDSTLPTAYIDMSGNREVLSAIHEHFQDQLTTSCAVGITHWEAREGDVATLPGPKPSLFFAPSQIVKRNQDWGPQEYQSRLTAATGQFLAQADNWITITESRFDDVQSVYDEVLNGAAPDKAIVVAL